MQQYVWDIDQEDKKELFEKGLLHFEDNKSLSKALGITPNNLSQHIKGGRNALNLDTAKRLLSIVNHSEPRYSLDQPEEYIEDRSRHMGVERVKLDENFHDYLFRSYSYEEIQELTGVKFDKAMGCRQNKYQTISEDMYLNLFEDAKERQDLMREEVEFEADIYRKADFASPHTEKGKVADSVSSENILEINATLSKLEESELIRDIGKDNIFEQERILNDLENISSNKKGFLNANIDLAALKIAKSLEEESRPYVDIDDVPKEFSKGLGRTYSILEDIGILEGGLGSSYEVVADKDKLEVLFPNLDSINTSVDDIEVYVKRRHIERLEDAALTSDSISHRSLEQEAAFLPSRSVYEREFKGWKNALWRAGLKSKNENYDSEIVADCLRAKNVELDRKLVAKDLSEDPDMPNPNTAMKYMDVGSIQELLEAANVSYNSEELKKEVLDNLYDGKWFSEENLDGSVPDNVSEGLAD